MIPRLLVPLLLLLLMGAPAAALASDSQSVERVSVFTYPLSVALGVIYPGGFAVPLGVGVPLNEDWELFADALVFGREDMLDDLPDRRLDGIFTSAGVTRRWSDRQGWSCFTTFKATHGLMASPVVGSHFLGGSSANALLGGADVGVEFRWGHLLLGSAVGASYGYCSGCRNELIAPLLPLGGEQRTTDRSGFAWMLNLHLLRVGFVL